MRSPVTLLLLISCFSIKFAHSQTPSNELLIFGQTGKLYLEHTVVAKENWYSVGRLYNISPKELAPFNHLALTQPLAIGQTLQVPLTPVNFSQNMLKTPAETLVPVIYVTQEKEWMYRISINHNKVPIPTLEKWNNITKDAVHPGMHLIVGYLKVKTSLSALATSTPPPAVATAKPITQPTIPTTPAATTTPSTTTPPATTTTATTPTKPTDSPAITKAKTNPPPATAITSKPTQPPATTTATPVSNPPTTTQANNNPPATTLAAGALPTPHFDGGIFKSEFLDNGKTLTGAAGIFKSTSGWQDGKYYALMNSVSIGSIVKITDATSGKSVFVKVLGNLPDMKESAGLTVRISNAAASEMGQNADRFNVQVSY